MPNQVGPGFSGFHLPAAGPQVSDQLIQAAGQFPEQLQQQKQQKLQMQQQKQQLEMGEQQMQQQTQANALKNLDMLYRVGQTDSSGKRYMDPNYVKGVANAAKLAGIGALTHIDPMTGEQVVDMEALNALTHGKLLSDLTPEEQKEVGQANPGAQRTAVLERLGVNPKNISADIINAPPESPFA